MHSLRALSRLPNGPRNVHRFLSTAYTYSKTGDPSAILLRTPVTAPAPTADNISVTWLAAGVDPVDIATLSGVNTPYAPSSYPAVPGTEGVAKVTAVGPAVENIAEGDLVIPVKTSIGTWCESATVKSDQVIRIPPIRLELAATLSASPFTALRLLSDFAQLSFGDVVLHNDAGSPVGTAIAQIAHSRGIRTISIVAESAPNYGPTVERLKLMGADVVIGEAYLDTTGFGAVLKDMPAPKLAINGGNANSSALLAGLMPKGCKMVTYCPGDADAEVLNKADVTNSQFSLPDWLATAKRSDVETMVSTLTDMIQEGKFTAWLQRVKFDELPSAIEEGGAYKRKLVAIMDNATQS